MARLSDAFIDDRAPANTNRGAGWRASARGRTQAAGATTWLSGAGGDGAAIRCFHRRPSGPDGHRQGDQRARAAQAPGQRIPLALPDHRPPPAAGPVVDGTTASTTLRMQGPRTP